METAQFVESVAGHPAGPGHRAAPDDTLRALLVAMRMCEALCEEISRDTGSPTRAAFHATVLERHTQRMELAQIRAAGTAQRTLIHELPPETLTALRTVAEDPGDYMLGRCPLPEDPRTVPTGRLEFRNTPEALQRMLGITYFEARDRLHAAWLLLPGTDVNGIPQGPRFPVLAGQLDAGAARVKDVAAAARKLDRLRPGIEARPDARELAGRVEEQVARSVAEGTARETGKLFDAIADGLDAAAEQPTPEEVRTKTGVFITRRTRHFTYLNVCLANDDAEILLSFFARSDNPRTRTGTGTGETLPQLPDFDFSDAFKNRFNSTIPGADGLSAPQRHLQGLVNAMRWPGQPAGGTDSRGQGTRGQGAGPTGAPPAARLVVLIQLDVLMGLARGAGYSAHGLEIPVGRVRRMLANDGVIPVVLGGRGEVLDVGREKRLLPGPLKHAVLARDGGCLYPGCTVPPELCEFNHIVQWQDGGATSVANCHPACTAHHHMIDNGELRVVIHDGLPHVVLPRYLDPEQVPRRNTHWQPAKPTLF
ncbi:HNH endonuclease signature motif containing protein [Paeniglutamicibacter sp. R2-26]|uniref:HNH endonuclease signature motif containing protein n=1 Tax=Paeniglutamicibacter sp. R2-26 TaxID=3144417 RepID=UPI003EE42ED7